MTDTELLSRLNAALHDGRAEIAFAAGLDSHMDFPGNSETDKGQFIVVALILLGLAWHFGTWPILAGTALFIVAVYVAFWRKIVRSRMRKRFLAKVMDDLKLWRKSWGFSGIALIAGGQSCQSPKGDWRSFAAALEEPSPTIAPGASLQTTLESQSRAGVETAP
jgi:hypothetical protein